MRINKSLITYIPASGAGSGTVTSVAMTVPSGVFTILGSPITSSGTLQVGLVNQLANTVWAGPSAGSESAPTFRALVEADIPNLSASKITSGTLSVGRGGTGATSLSGVLIGNGTSAFSTASSVTSGQLLRVNTLGTGYEFFTPSFIVSTDIIATSPLVWNSGTNTMSIPAATNVADGYLTSADWLTFSSKQPAITLTTTGNSGASTLVGATLNVPEYTLAGLGGMTNPMTSLGDMIYGNAVGIPLRLAANTTTTKKYLSQTGDGTSGDQPFWDTITASGLGAVPTSRTLTINGTTYDLTANRSWTVGGVTSVGLSSTTSGVTIGSTPITTSGTITIDIATASSTTDGLLSSADWAYFDDKMGNPFTSLGDILYSNAIGIGLRRAGNTTTTKMFLSQTGDGTNSAAPQWSVVTASDTGAVPTSRTITINDVVFDLSANRSWSVGDFGTW